MLQISLVIEKSLNCRGIGSVVLVQVKMELSQPSDETKVLVIYTGGTIGMLVGKSGYVPEPYLLTETLRSQHRFHDPLEESLFSHSASVEGFREWSSQAQSGRASPVVGLHESAPSSPRQEGYPRTFEHHHTTLLVRSSRPIGELDHLKTGSTSQGHHSPRNVACTTVAENLYEAHIPSLVTPRTSTTGSSNKRIRYAVSEVWATLIPIRLATSHKFISGTHC